MKLGFYSKQQVIDLTSLSATTLWREAKAERFPRPIKISAGRVGYPRNEVDAWLQAKLVNAEQT